VFDLEGFERDGFTIVPGVVDRLAVGELLDALSALVPGGAALGRGGRVYASRDLLGASPRVRALAASAATRTLVEPVLGPNAFAVRGLLFDKTPEANWMVPWHQDLTVAVKARADAPGFGPWTVKTGVPHVQPPADVLGRMVSVRVHLDDCRAGCGPLRVVPGSHRQGRLNVEQTRAWLERVAPVACPVPQGGALVMRPLILHASSASDDPGHRRVIHLEYAADPLPSGVEWWESRPAREGLRS